MSDPIRLDRVGAAPLKDEKFSPEFIAWLSVTVDTINEIIQTIENALNT